MKNNPANITELRDRLLDAYTLLEADPKRALQASELANVAGKVIGTLKLELEYSISRREQPEIPFFGKTSGRPLPGRSTPQLPG